MDAYSTYVWQKWLCVGVRKVIPWDGRRIAKTNDKLTSTVNILYTQTTYGRLSRMPAKHNIKSVALQRRKIYIHTTGLHSGPLPSTACFSTQTRPSFRMAQDIFDLNLFPYKYPNNLIPVILLPHVEVRCPLPCPEVTGVTIQVPSPRYW